MKKQVTILLDENVLKELKRRAKRDFMSLTELIQHILWKSAKTSKRRKTMVPVGKYIELFSRQRRKTRKKKVKRKKKIS